MSLPFSTSLFSCTWMYSCSSRSDCSAQKAKKSSHPWHFQCWSPRRNELECTNLVHWTEALHCFSSRDAIIIVGSVFEKHFDDESTRDQEKEITLKRWPPGYQSWKLSSALNRFNHARKFLRLPYATSDLTTGYMISTATHRHFVVRQMCLVLGVVLWSVVNTKTNKYSHFRLVQTRLTHNFSLQLT